MSSFGYASEGDIFLFSSAMLRKQKGDVQAELAIEWGFRLSNINPGETIPKLSNSHRPTLKTMNPATGSDRTSPLGY
jgi:hypothetical protein